MIEAHLGSNARIEFERATKRLLDQLDDALRFELLEEAFVLDLKEYVKNLKLSVIGGAIEEMLDRQGSADRIRR